MTLLPDPENRFGLPDALRLPPPPALPDRNPFSLSGSVGRFGANRRADLIKAQVLLGNAGYYALASLGAPTGWPGGEIERALLKLQKDHGLQADGVMLPGGETMALLQDRLGDRLAGYEVPTPEEADAHYEERARRAARGEADDGTPISEITVASEDGEADQPPGTLRRPRQTRTGTAVPPWSMADIDPPPQLQWKDGGQVAQAVVVASPPATFPATTDMGGERDQYGVSEAEKQVGRALEKHVMGTVGLLKLPPQLLARMMQDGETFMPTEGAAPLPPSEPISDEEKTQTRTPPLEPSQIDDKLQGRPADPAEPTVEQLIPPEMKAWFEGLEPFDQELAKELFVVFNKGGRRGEEPTRLGNWDIVHAVMEYYRSERPDIAQYLTHVAGSREGAEDGRELPEEYIKGRNSGGVKGATWPDITIRYARQLAHETVEEYLRLFSGRTLQDGITGVKSERDQLAKAEYNLPGELFGFMPKLLADKKDGTVSAEQRAAYRALIKPLAEEIGWRFEELLRSKGKY